MDFKKVFAEELPKAVMKHRNQVWKNGQADLETLTAQVNEILQKSSEGVLGVNLATHEQGNVDNYTEMRVMLWNMQDKKLIGTMDRYLVSVEGGYPVVLVLEGAPGQPAPQGHIGDKMGLQMRFLHLLADVQSKLIEVISANMPENLDKPE